MRPPNLGRTEGLRSEQRKPVRNATRKVQHWLRSRVRCASFANPKMTNALPLSRQSKSLGNPLCGKLFGSSRMVGLVAQPRSVFRSGCHVERCRQAPVHHSRVSRFSALGSTGHYFDGRLDSPSRREALAYTASRHLFCGDCRRDSFLLESKIRRAVAALLRRARCNPALVEIG